MSLSFSIIGTGALGSALARALQANGYELSSLYNRTIPKAEKLARELGVESVNVFPDSDEDDPLGKVVFITVSDGVIREVSTRLSEYYGSLDGKIIVHCSGNETSSLLSNLRKRGALVAAFHPLQTFSEPTGSEDFKQIYFSLEGDRHALPVLEQVAEKLGAHTFRISEPAKPFLHAAAVMASNYLMVLLEGAGEVAALGDIDPSYARKALLPLAQTALEKATVQGPADALSGPIARGDVVTVKKHLDLLQNEDVLLTLYKKLGLKALEMAKGKGSISGEIYAELFELLNSTPGDR